MGKVKYIFYATRNNDKLYFREEYNETLDKHRRINNDIWNLDEIEEWAIENDYKVNRDFTINPEKFFHNTY